MSDELVGDVIITGAEGRGGSGGAPVTTTIGSRVEGRVHRADRSRSAVLGVALWLLFLIPLLVALQSFTSPQWHPIADLAQTELRVRDVGTAETPLIGLAGRIGTFGDQGSHAGPLSFWALAPVYRLLGSSAAALATSALALHALAAGLALWLALRRGGTPLLLGVGIGIVLVARTLGPRVFLEPWNPYLPVSWWVVFLLAVWGVLDDDLATLPVAVGAGSFCAQTHLPYLGLVGGLAALVAGRLLWSAVRARQESERPRVGDQRRWVGGAAVLGVLLWTPPVLDQIFGTGNLTKIRQTLSEPDGPVAGVATGAKVILGALDPRWLFTRTTADQVSVVDHWSLAAVLMLMVWVAVGALSWARAPQVLRRLHLLVAAGTMLAFVSAARVNGLLWGYLFLWTKALSLLMMVAVAWSASILLESWAPAGRHGRMRTVAAAGLVLAGLVAAGVSTGANLDTEPPAAPLSQELGVAAAETEASLAGADVPGGGRSGRYLVRWDDPVAIGSQGFGLVNELERAGFTVGVDGPFGPGAVPHRIIDAGDATAVVQLATGPAIDRWRREPGGTRVAYADARSPGDRALSDRLARNVEEQLRIRGLTSIGEEWQQNRFTASIRPDVPEDIRAEMVRTNDIGVPIAVFVFAAPGS